MIKERTVRVVTDTGCSYQSGDPDTEGSGVTFIPLQLSIIESGQWKAKQETEIGRDQFYQIMARMIAEQGELPQTSGLNPGIARDTYLNIFADEGVECVYSTHITKAHSQAWNAARVGAEEASNKLGKDLAITVADSKQLSIGQWWVAMHAAWVAKKGARLKQIVEEVSELLPKIHLLVVLETFENLKKGGRADQIKGILASMLSTIAIHPILGLKDGKLDLFGRARNAKKARARIVEMVGDMGELAKVAVIHTNAPALAEEVRNGLTKIFRGMIPKVDAGPALATHAGEKAVGIASLVKD